MSQQNRKLPLKVMDDRPNRQYQNFLNNYNDSIGELNESDESSGHRKKS